MGLRQPGSRAGQARRGREGDGRNAGVEEPPDRLFGETLFLSSGGHELRGGTRLPCRHAHGLPRVGGHDRGGHRVPGEALSGVEGALAFRRRGPGEHRRCGCRRRAPGKEVVHMTDAAPTERSQINYSYDGPSMAESVATLEEKKSNFREMGGAERVQRQHDQNKLTVRERMGLLFDQGTFAEHGLLAHHQSQSPAMQGKLTPADGVVTGIGEIDGRKVAVIAYDFTVMAGSIGMVTEIKSGRMREIALRERIPLVWLVDSAGARIQEATGSMFARTGDLFREQVVMSGVVPQVAAMMGPGAAGTAYIPGLADFVPMVKGTSNMALGGPHLVKAAVGEDVTAEEMGGSKVHTKISGVADLEVGSDQECLDAVRKYL